jgi:hypothetical protein
MPPQIDERLLHGTWIRVHEEDAPGQAVFRRPGAPLPPARGRIAYEFLPGGHVTTTGSGPVDRTVSQDGTWSLEPQGRVTIRLPGQSGHELEVLSVDADRLVVKM